MRAEAFVPEAVCAELAAIGACAVPLLTEPFRARLLVAAHAVPYRLARREIRVADGVVRQELEYCATFGPESPFLELAQAIQDVLERGFRGLTRYPFAVPLRLHEPMVQHYEAGWLGITPHRDQASYINLVALVVLGGEGRFYVCAARDGGRRRDIASRPGDVILIRCPGFLGTTDRVFHGVDHIAASRHTLGLRQDGPQA